MGYLQAYATDVYRNTPADKRWLGMIAPLSDVRRRRDTVDSRT
jgi:hypothetical protein